MFDISWPEWSIELLFAGVPEAAFAFERAELGTACCWQAAPNTETVNAAARQNIVVFFIYSLLLQCDRS
jgi:hypothetical protein